MKREPTLRRRIEVLGTLDQAISAMKSVSAHHFRLARGQLAPARAYRESLERTLSQVGLALPEPGPGPVGLLVIASDLGLCGNYNSRLVDAALRRRSTLGEGPTHCVGHRAQTLLTRAGQKVEHAYAAPTGVASLGNVLMQLAEDLLTDFLEGRVSRVVAVSARFVGVGEFEPTETQLIPVQPPPGPVTVRVSPYVGAEQLAIVGLRELLYISVYELFLDALASEYGARLVATTSASDWLDQKLAATRRMLQAIRVESATQELLEITAGARVRR